MRETILVSTRKGLFEVGKGKSAWAVKDAAFLGDNVTLAIRATARIMPHSITAISA
jgi:hypothetical protein